MKKLSILLFPLMMAFLTYLLCKPTTAHSETKEDSNKQQTIAIMEKTYVFLADGFEEIEALATVDLLRRAGIHVETVSINPTLAVRGAHDIEVAADIMLADCPEGARMYIVPGGMPGAKNLADNPKVCQILTAQHEAGGKIAAICAAPAVVLAPLGIINEYEATCYPGFEEGVTAGGAQKSACGRRPQHHHRQRSLVGSSLRPHYHRGSQRSGCRRQGSGRNTPVTHRRVYS